MEVEPFNSHCYTGPSPTTEADLTAVLATPDLLPVGGPTAADHAPDLCPNYGTGQGQGRDRQLLREDADDQAGEREPGPHLHLRG